MRALAVLCLLLVVSCAVVYIQTAPKVDDGAVLISGKAASGVQTDLQRERSVIKREVDRDEK